MTIGDNIGFGLKQRGVSKPERDAEVQKIAATFGISHLLERHPRTLSRVNSSEVQSPGHFSCDHQFFIWMNLFPLWIRSRVSVSEMNSRRFHKVTGMTILHISHHFEGIMLLPIV